MLETALAHLRRVAPDTLDIPILQPADPFLETAGEDLRRRIFITQDAGGMAQCLRPEFTIPICLEHGDAGDHRRYAYGGTVFRQMRDGASEFQQAGLEDLGTGDAMAADAACLADALAALATLGIADMQTSLGDQALFGVVVDNLKLPQPLAERLLRNFGSGEQMRDLLNRLTEGTEARHSDPVAGQLADAGDEAGLIAHIEQIMAESGLSPRAGRDPAHIAQRMIEQVRQRGFTLSGHGAELLRGFLDLETSAGGAVAAIHAFGAGAGMDFGTVLEQFEQRLEGLVARDVALDRITFKASLGRKLDYYTGMVFEVFAHSLPQAVAGGGRYDRLCTLLGSPSPVPAVGFSLSLDRVAAALQGRASQ
ncbi:MAG: ATP phosphoribosyltransferase regulatory subunit [Pseudomonadota bacterium]